MLHVRDEPSPDLARLLAHLRLAGEPELARARRYIARHRRAMPLFDAVWIEALAQTGALSLYQSAEFLAGRGAELELGPFVLVERIQSLGAIETCQAFERETRKPVQLAVFSGIDDAEVSARLANLIGRSRRIDSEHVAPVRFARLLGSRALVSCDWIEGESLAAVLLRERRFDSAFVRDLLRQLLAGLEAIDRAGLAHGDLAPREIVCRADGTFVLLAPGARPACREAENATDLEPEALANLSPARAAGQPAGLQDDIYALGLLAWQLLAGRPAFPIANRLATLQAVQSGRVLSIRKVALEIDTALATAIDRCLGPDPGERPRSYHELRSLLGGEMTSPAPRARQSSRARSLGHLLPRRWALAAGVAALVIGFGIAAISLRGSAVEPTSSHAKSPAPASSDSEVARASATGTPVGERANVVRAGYAARAEATDDLVLPSDRPLYLQTLHPQPGQSVRGEPGTRPVIWLTRGGLAIAANNVRFENIDFIWSDPPSGTSAAAFLELSSDRVALVGCSFTLAEAVDRRPAAIRFADKPGSGNGLKLPTSFCEMHNCVALGVGPLVAQGRADSLAARFSNVLLAGAPSAVAFERATNRESPTTILFERCTLREVDACLELPDTTQARTLGRIVLKTDHCVFAPRSTGGLVLLDGPSAPRWLPELEWSGQGSLVSASARLVQWSGHLSTQLDDRLRITGLVRSELAFDGPAGQSPTASQIVDWSAPLLSDGPPGANVSELPAGP